MVKVALGNDFPANQVLNCTKVVKSAHFAVVKEGCLLVQNL